MTEYYLTCGYSHVSTEQLYDARTNTRVSLLTKRANEGLTCSYFTHTTHTH